MSGRKSRLGHRQAFDRCERGVEDWEGCVVFHVRRGFLGTNLGGRGLEIHRSYVIGHSLRNTLLD